MCQILIQMFLNTLINLISTTAEVDIPSLNLFIPGGASGNEPACQCRRHKRHGFHP